MRATIIDWLDASPTRWHVVNIAQWTAILALSGQARGVLGGAALIVLAIWTVRTAVGGRINRRINQGQVHPFAVVLALWPQIFGLTVAAVALHLSNGPGWANLWLVLFGLQAAAVVLWTTQIAQGKAQTCRVPHWTEAV